MNMAQLLATVNNLKAIGAQKGNFHIQGRRHTQPGHSSFTTRVYTVHNQGVTWYDHRPGSLEAPLGFEIEAGTRQPCPYYTLLPHTSYESQGFIPLAFARIASGKLKPHLMAPGTLIGRESRSRSSIRSWRWSRVQSKYRLRLLKRSDPRGTNPYLDSFYSVFKY